MIPADLRVPSSVAAAVTLLVLTLVGTSAVARDLPRRAATATSAAEDKCGALGTGFHQVAGSDTCIRLSGSMEVGAVISTGSGGSSAGDWMGRGRR